MTRNDFYDLEVVELGNTLSLYQLEADINEAMSTLLCCCTKFDVPEQVEAIATPLTTLHTLLEEMKDKYQVKRF